MKNGAEEKADRNLCYAVSQCVRYGNKESFGTLMSSWLTSAKTITM